MKKINIEKQDIENQYSFKFRLVNLLGINPRQKSVFLTKEAKFLLNNQKKLPSSELQKRNCIQFLKDNKSYRGIRHKIRLPVRGQRTHTNAKTRKKKKVKF